MKSLFIQISLLVMLIIPVMATGQKTFLSLGAEIALPGSSHSIGMNAGTGWGGSLKVESIWGKHIAGTASLGYLDFAEAHPYSSTPATTAKVNAILFQPGLKYYIPALKERPGGFFISAEFGLMFTNTHFKYETYPDNKFKETGLSCAPGIGYLIGKLETGFRLQYNLTASGFNVYYYNFRLAYAFLKSKK